MPSERPKLGVIIPYVQEWPQIAFTIRAIHEDLQNVPHEIVAVDNMCPQAWEQVKGGRAPNRVLQVDRGHDRQEIADKTCVPAWENRYDKAQDHESSIKGAAKRLPWLTYVKYDERLSHWQAKRVGCAATDAPILLFADSHTSPGRGCLSGMYKYYVEHGEELNGSLHAPLSYQILEERKMTYKLVYERGLLGYSLTGYQNVPEPYEVPVMSTCGMMISREILDSLGGWPEELGIYGGGENFMNAALAVTGRKKWIKTGPALHHHGDKRGYHYDWLDHKRNQAIAMYLADGEWAMWNYMTHLKPFKDKEELFRGIGDEIIETCREQRELIESKQVFGIEEWVKSWKE